MLARTCITGFCVLVLGLIAMSIEFWFDTTPQSDPYYSTKLLIERGTYDLYIGLTTGAFFSLLQLNLAASPNGSHPNDFFAVEPVPTDNVK